MKLCACGDCRFCFKIRVFCLHLGRREKGSRMSFVCVNSRFFQSLDKNGASLDKGCTWWTGDTNHVLIDTMGVAAVSLIHMSQVFLLNPPCP